MYVSFALMAINTHSAANESYYLCHQKTTNYTLRYVPIWRILLFFDRFAFVSLNWFIPNIVHTWALYEWCFHFSNCKSHNKHNCIVNSCHVQNCSIIYLCYLEMCHLHWFWCPFTRVVALPSTRGGKEKISISF